MPRLQLVPAFRARSPLIFVGSDLTEGSDAALAYAVKLGMQLGANVVVLHVVEQIGQRHPQNSPLVRRRLLAVASKVDLQKATARRALAKQIGRLRLTPDDLVMEVAAGALPRTLIARTAKKRAVLLVLGLANQAAGLGAVGQAILKTTRVPVAIVPGAIVERPQRRGPSKPKLSLVPKPRKRSP